MNSERRDNKRNTTNPAENRSRNTAVGSFAAQRILRQNENNSKIMTLEQATREREIQPQTDMNSGQQEVPSSSSTPSTRPDEQTPQRLAQKRQSQQQAREQRQEALRQMISGRPSGTTNTASSQGSITGAKGRNVAGQNAAGSQEQPGGLHSQFYQEQAARIQAKKDQANRQQAAAAARQAYKNQAKISAQAKVEQEMAKKTQTRPSQSSTASSAQTTPAPVRKRRPTPEPIPVIISESARKENEAKRKEIGEVTYQQALKERQRQGQERRIRKVGIFLALVALFAGFHFIKPDFFPALIEETSDIVTQQVTALVDKIQGDLLEEDEEETAEPEVPQTPPPQEAVVSLYFSPDQLYSPYVYLLDRYDKTPLMQISSNIRVSPASLTKIMTALVAIEQIPDLQQIMTVPSDIFPYLYTSHASVAGFSPNEQVPVIDLLYGCALPSGADAALTLAVGVAGSEAGYAALMNEKAQSLGMLDTSFANVSGLYHPDNYSTAQDMAILLDHALDNETFRRIFSTKQYTTTPTPQHPSGLTFGSTVFGRMGSPYFADGEILGGKTGYIYDAGMCLASFAVRKDREFVLITMGAAGDPYVEPLHLRDAFTAYGSLVDKGSEAPVPEDYQTTLPSE